MVYKIKEFLDKHFYIFVGVFFAIYILSIFIPLLKIVFPGEIISYPNVLGHLRIFSNLNHWRDYYEQVKLLEEEFGVIIETRTLNELLRNVVLKFVLTLAAILVSITIFILAIKKKNIYLLFIIDMFFLSFSFYHIFLQIGHATSVIPFVSFYFILILLAIKIFYFIITKYLKANTTDGGDV